MKINALFIWGACVVHERIKVLLIITLACSLTMIQGQTLEVRGPVKINSVSSDFNSTSIVVWTADSLLALREMASLRCVDSITQNNNVGPFFIGKDTLGGIVFEVYIGQDGLQHGLIVSKTETLAKWHTNTTSRTWGADRSWDGVYNMDKMGNSPAKNWITTNFSSEWYLPSIDELNLLYDARYHVNAASHAGGHTLLDNIAIYWSSTENGGSLAYNIRFFTGENSRNLGKNSTRRVRAIRAF